jgi:hypothetical protein
VRGRSSGSLRLICIIIESSDAGVFLGAKLIMRRQSFKYDPLAVYFVCDADCCEQSLLVIEWEEIGTA